MFVADLSNKREDANRGLISLRSFIFLSERSKYTTGILGYETRTISFQLFPQGVFVDIVRTFLANFRSNLSPRLPAHFHHENPGRPLI